MTNQRLYRSSTTRVFGGVAGGIGEYFVIDPVIVRIIFVLLTLFGGGGLLIYIVLWIALPERSLSPSPEKEPYFHAEESSPAKPDRKVTNLVLAVILIGLGLILLIDNLLPWLFVRNFWPLALVFGGILLLGSSFLKKN